MTNLEYGTLPSIVDLRTAQRVCLQLIQTFRKHVPWYKRWMYPIAQLREVAEKMGTTAAWMECNERKDT